MPPPPHRTPSRLAVLGDAALAMMAAQGDHAAFAALVPRASPPVRALLRRIGADHASADDIAQEALLTAFRRISTYRGEAPFVSWVMRIAARLYFKRLRRDSKLELVSGAPDTERPGPPPEADSVARLDLDRALTRLSAGERLCVSLCHGVGMSHSEIADTTGLPLGTVKSHVSRGLRRLRELMLGDDDDRKDDDARR